MSLPMMEQFHFQLPFTRDYSVTVAFDGVRACRLGRLLASLLGLSGKETGPFGTSSVLTLASDGKLPAEQGSLLSPRCTTMAIEEEGHRIVLHVPGKSGGLGEMKITLKLLFVLAVRCARHDGVAATLLHGNLLRMPQAQEAIACFGPSGMGKTSVAHRWVEQGGECLADDMLLVFREGEAFSARPLLTFSRFPEPVDYTLAVALRGLFRLNRGKGDAIVAAADPLFWRYELLREIMFHYGGADFLSTTETSRVLDFAASQAEEMQRLYGSHDIMGDLAGHILRNVQKTKGSPL